jgi:acetyltransferase-like isoleucine patch superfamily enzyme
MDVGDMYSEQEAKAISMLYEMDKQGGVFSSVPQCFIDMSSKIGERTKVWHYARVLGNCVIGDDVSIGGGTEIGRGTVIGNRTRIGANCFLPSNTKIGEQVFVGPGVVMTDDKYPKVPGPLDPPYIAQPPTIGSYANIGAGVVILPGIIIGEYAFIAAGSVVTKDVEAHTRVIGAPARLMNAA